MRARVILVTLAGVALAVGLVIYYGVDEIVGAFLAAGWQGVLAMSAIHVFSLVLCGFAWWTLQPESPGQASLVFLWARWLRDSVGNILAILPIAGELVSARELSFHRVGRGMAGATTVIDLTMELLSQVLFTFLGIAILAAEKPGADGIGLGWAVAGLAVATVAILGFAAVQRAGVFRLLETVPERLGLMRGWRRKPDLASVHEAIRRVYGSPRRLLLCITLHLVAWIVGTGEAWIGLRFMGVSLGVADVLVIESLVFALRSAGFFVPLAAGVQEGGYVLVGALFGLGPEAALALSLLKRAREVVTGVPALLVWQAVEGRRLWSRTPVT